MPFAVHQRHKAEIGQFLFATVGNRHLGRALHGDVAFVGGEVVGRQTFDQSAAFDTAHGYAHAVKRVGLGHLGAQRVGGIHPQVLGVVGAVHLLFVVEFLDGLGVLAVGQTRQSRGSVSAT